MLTRETIESLGFKPDRVANCWTRCFRDGRRFDIWCDGTLLNGDDECKDMVWLGKVANDAELIALCRAIPGWDDEKRDG
jgi:hypothetical protein